MQIDLPLERVSVVTMPPGNAPRPAACGEDCMLTLPPCRSTGSKKTGRSAAPEWRFSVELPGRKLVMAAPSEEVMEDWATAIRQCAARAPPPRPTPRAGDTATEQGQDTAGAGAAGAAVVADTAAATAGAAAAAAAAKPAPPKKEGPLTTADFLFGRTLGEGAYARVVLAQVGREPLTSPLAEPPRD